MKDGVGLSGNIEPQGDDGVGGKPEHLGHLALVDVEGELGDKGKTLLLIFVNSWGTLPLEVGRLVMDNLKPTNGGVTLREKEKERLKMKKKEI